MAGLELDLEAIVREVLRRLQQLSDAGTAGAGDGAGTENQALAKPASQEPAVDPAQLQLADRTITMGLVAGRLGGVKEVLVPAGAVVTPSVRDELRKRQIAVRTSGRYERGLRDPARPGPGRSRRRRSDRCRRRGGASGSRRSGSDRQRLRVGGRASSDAGSCRPAADRLGVDRSPCGGAVPGKPPGEHSRGVGRERGLGPRRDEADRRQHAGRQSGAAWRV